MEFGVRLLLSVLVIVVASQVGKRVPSLGGLIATMPLTTLIVMLWLYADQPGDYSRMVRYTKGVLWGILPSVGFFLVVLAGLGRQWPMTHVLAAGFGVWLLGAVVHQWLLR